MSIVNISQAFVVDGLVSWLRYGAVNAEY